MIRLLTSVSAGAKNMCATHIRAYWVQYKARRMAINVRLIILAMLKVTQK
jgi:hypothetical protein